MHATPRILLALAACSIAFAGCAAPRSRPISTADATTRPSHAKAATTRPATAERTKADLRLAEIDPKPQMPEPRRVRESGPPLESIELFAKARGLIQQRPREAVGLLERAILLDKESYELYYSLGEAHQAGSSGNERALEAFEKAAELRPDSIEVRLQLALQYLNKSRYDRALANLRLAQLTPAYKKDNEDSATVDLLLARVLQQLGYEQAALDYYERTLDRVTRPGPMVRRNSELMLLVSRPEIVEILIAELAEKRGQPERAVAALRSALAREPNEFDLHARLLRMLATNGNVQQTTDAALELVRRFRASDQSMKLLREVYDQLGRGDELTDDLRRLHEAHPGDRPLLLALVDALQQQGQTEQAEVLLAEAARSDPADTEVLRRLVTSLEQRDQIEPATRWLIEAAAREPATLRATTDLWDDLLEPGRKVRLKLTDLRKMELPAWAEAARQFWVSRLSDMWNRETLSREALHRSVDQEEVFAPSYRLLLASIWGRPDYQEATKVEQSQELIQRASSKGDTALAEELKGLLALRQQQVEPAMQHFAAAMAAGTPSPELQLNYAEALIVSRDFTKAEQTLWKLVSDWPRFGDAYDRLFNLYLTRRQAQQALRVLQTWLDKDPSSVDARLLRALLLADRRQGQMAEQELLQLFAEAGDNDDVLAALQGLYLRSGRVEEWVRLLEREHEKNPDNHRVTGRLAMAYDERNRKPEAIALLDDARKRAAGEPDLLYYLAHLYTPAGQKEAANETLEEVIRIDPTHAAAANDLGYAWADEGVNLDRAEALIRIAVDEEPDNQAFLDSLAWVLYKRGKFDEARKYLEQALDASLRPDPIVVDHLGDALYQLGRKDDAAKQWQRAMDMLQVTGTASRQDLIELRLTLTRKLRAVGNNEAAPVAATVEGPATRPAEAKGEEMSK